MEPSRRAPERELILANHAFPCAYTVKAFGPAHDEFRVGIETAIIGAVAVERVSFSVRSTRSGHRICITAEIAAESVDEVIAAYESLYEVPGLQLIL